MWSLAGLIQKVINNVQTLLSRLTSTRASNLDLIDDIESDTSNLNSRLTSTRASRLDYIRRSQIRRIQFVTGSIQAGDRSGGETLDYPVADQGKTILVMCGVQSSSTDPADHGIEIGFDADDKIYFLRESTGSAAFLAVQVVEFY